MSSRTLWRRAALAIGLACAASVTAQTAVAPAGSGTSVAPYEIDSLPNLLWLSTASDSWAQDLEFRLTRNIDASSTQAWNDGAGFAGIGSAGNPFKGKFHGNGKTISGLWINRPSTDSVGLFRTIDATGSVDSLILSGATVKGRSYFGALFALNKGAITAVQVTGAVVTSDDSSSSPLYAGRMGGANAGTIDGAVWEGPVTAVSRYANTLVAAAGFVCNNSGRIYRSRSAGVVSSTSNGANANSGGFVDFNSGTIERSFSEDSLLVATTQIGIAGGITSWNQSPGVVKDCYSTSPNAFYGGSPYTGGVVALNFSSILTSYAAGRNTGTGMVGGVLGMSMGGSTTNCYWDKNATGIASGSNGTGLDSASMLQAASFTGFNFDTVWTLYPGKTAPLLRHFMTPLLVAAKDSSKTYDGVTFSGAGAAFTPANVDGSKILGSLVATGTSQGAIDTGHYSMVVTGGLYSSQLGYLISYASTPATLAIGPRALTIAGAKVASKIYDGTVAATVSADSLAGKVPGDAVTLTLGTASFATKDTGTAKSVTVSGSSLSGAKAANYTLVEASGLTASIFAKNALVTAAAQTKVYGSADPVLTHVDTGLVNGDVLTGALSRTAGDTVGKYAITLGTLSGGANYSLTYVGDSLSVTLKSALVTAAAQTKAYGSADPILTHVDTGLVNGDVLTGELSRAVGDTVGKYAITLGTVAASRNYSLTYVGDSLSVTPKSALVTAAAQTKVYGSADPILTHVDTGLVNGDVLTGALSRAVGDTVGKYAITQGTLSGGANYSLTYVGDSLSVTPAALTITAKDTAKDFDAADPVFTAKFSGFVYGEDASVVTGLTLVRDTGSKAGDYAIVPSGATAANYAISYVNGTLTVKEPVTGIAPSLRKPVSKLLSANVPNVFAKPSLVGGRGALGLSIPGCDQDNSCLSVDVLLPQAASIEVGIYDNLGVRVIGWSTVVSGADLERLPATQDGRHVAHMGWNLRSESGRAVPEGVYLWMVRAVLADGSKLENVFKMGVKK